MRDLVQRAVTPSARGIRPRNPFEIEGSPEREAMIAAHAERIAAAGLSDPSRPTKPAPTPRGFGGPKKNPVIDEFGSWFPSVRAAAEHHGITSAAIWQSASRPGCKSCGRKWYWPDAAPAEVLTRMELRNAPNQTQANQPTEAVKDHADAGGFEAVSPIGRIEHAYGLLDLARAS